MKLLLLFALAASAFAEKPSLTDAQKAALMTAKADQLQAENNVYKAQEMAAQSAIALEKLVADTLRGIGCEGGQLVRKQGSPDIEVSCPVPAVPAGSK